MHLSIHTAFGAQSKRSDASIGWSALFINVLASSTYGGFAKSLRTHFSPIGLLIVSDTLVWLMTVLSFGIRPIVRRIACLTHRRIAILAAVALCSGVGAPLLWFTGLKYTTALNAGFFSKMETVALLLLSRFILREKLSPAHVVAILSVLSGIICIALQGFRVGITLNVGDGGILGASVLYATGSILYRVFLSHLHPADMLFARSSAAVGVFFLFSVVGWLQFSGHFFFIPLILIPTLLGFAIISRLLNTYSFYLAMERLPITTVSLVSSLDVIGGAIFVALYLGEPILWYHVLGGSFIMLGTVILELVGMHKNSEDMQQHLAQHA